MINFRPIGLWILNTEFEDGVIPLIKCSLKAELHKFWNLESIFFHSTMAHGKKDDLRLSVLHCYVEIFSTDMVKKRWELPGINLNK